MSLCCSTSRGLLMLVISCPAQPVLALVLVRNICTPSLGWYSVKLDVMLQVKLCLVINKMDRLIQELHLTPAEAYERLSSIVTHVNMIISSFQSEQFITEADAVLAHEAALASGTGPPSRCDEHMAVQLIWQSWRRGKCVQLFNLLPWQFVWKYLPHENDSREGHKANPAPRLVLQQVKQSASFCQMLPSALECHDQLTSISRLLAALAMHLCISRGLSPCGRLEHCICNVLAQCHLATQVAAIIS